MKTARHINSNQEALYWRDWGKARRSLLKSMSPAEANARRHAIHVEKLGEDKSHKHFTNDDLDKVLGAFRAISNPASLNAQMAAADQPAKRGRFLVLELLAALGWREEQLNELIERRLRAGVLVTVETEAGATFENLGPDDLERLALDLKAECLRRWPRKGELHTELRLIRMSNDFDEVAAAAAVRKALGKVSMPAEVSLSYEQLLKVIATLRRLAGWTFEEVPF